MFEDRRLSVDEIATYLGIKRDTVYKWTEWTRYPQLKWDNSQDELEEMHVLFMTNGLDNYIDKLFARLREMVK